MELIKRTTYSNQYFVKEQQYQLDLGGVPNVIIDANKNLAPLDNTISFFDRSTNYNYTIKRSNFYVHLGDKKSVGKYKRFIKSKIDKDVWILITLKNLNTQLSTTFQEGQLNNKIEWVSDKIKFNSFITEKRFKETIHQPKGQTIIYQYEINGLKAVLKNHIVKFYTITDNKLFALIERPFYQESGIIFDYVWKQTAINIFELTLPAPKKDSIIDPTITFGEATGADVTGVHKDTFLAGGSYSNRSYGAYAYMIHSQTATDQSDRAGILRFDLNTIPNCSIVNNASLRLTLSNNGFPAGGDRVFNIRRMITNWGKTLIEEGGTNTPAAANEATWDNAFAGGAQWSGGAGGYWLVNDSENPESNIFIPQGTVQGTQFDFDITSNIQYQVVNPALNYGLAIQEDISDRVDFAAQEHDTVGYRPLLSVVYTIPTNTKIFGMHPASNVTGIHKDTFITSTNGDSAYGDNTELRVSSRDFAPLL